MSREKQLVDRVLELETQLGRALQERDDLRSQRDTILRDGDAGRRVVTAALAEQGNPLLTHAVKGNVVHDNWGMPDGESVRYADGPT